MRLSLADERMSAVTWAGLVCKNLLRRKVRTGLTVAGVAIGVGLIVALLSITAGVKHTANDLIHVGRSDFGVFQQGASDLTRSVLPESLDAKVRSDPGRRRRGVDLHPRQQGRRPGRVPRLRLQAGRARRDSGTW